MGPEGTAAKQSLLDLKAFKLESDLFNFHIQVKTIFEYRPYFENYTVDASIFVVKLLSANGECLGTSAICDYGFIF